MSGSMARRPPASRRARGWTRRRLLKAGAAVIAAAVPSTALLGSRPSADASPHQKRGKHPHVIVVGAGAFGGWTALALRRHGARVTLLDTWGPGNSRASSGGDSRLIRGIYGPDRIYVEMAARALHLWRENERRWNQRLYRRTGVLWMISGDSTYTDASFPFMREAGLEYEELTLGEGAARFPQINLEGVRRLVFEPDAGYLLARRACQAVLAGFVAEGGEYRQSAVSPGAVDAEGMTSVTLANRTSLRAGIYVFACGPWLGRLFPDVIGTRIRPTRQEVYYFGTPAGDALLQEEHCPSWIEDGAQLYYGMPGNARRGFKVADDARGADFDPTSGDRIPSEEGLRAARRYIALRFPALRGAPLLEARVCQYENTPDGHFIIDRHPGAGNVWLLGGGSGHGFKHGPAFGERAAAAILGHTDPDPMFGLSRFS